MGGDCERVRVLKEERATQVGIEKAIVSYLTARSRFHAVADRFPAFLKGNDNIVGRIGEYLAMLCLKRQGRDTRKVRSRNEKGHDLLCGRTRITVKMLTTENAAGRGVRLTDPWNEFILIDFDAETHDYRVGHLLKREFRRARTEHPTWSTRPVVKKTMLGKGGLVGHYGFVSAPARFPGPSPEIPVR